MKIQQLELENFRGAKTIKFHEDLKFDPHMNVFYGINGSGKSSILDAISILLSWLPARLKAPNGSGHSIKITDINNSASSAKIAIVVNYADSEFCWSITCNRSNTLKVKPQNFMTQVDELCRKLTQGSSPAYPVLVFYPVNRVVVDLPLLPRNRSVSDPLDTYQNSLSGTPHFQEFLEWYREREDLENEMRRDAGIPVKKPLLDTVRQALEQFFPSFTNLTVKRNPLHMEVKKYGETLWLNQLSAGEKCLLALVGDLARRLAIANETNPPNALTGEGSF